MDVGARVVLRTFQGLAEPPSGVREDENYWALIGSTGRVLEMGGSADSGWPGARLLILFAADVAGLGLECHNPVPNSLWIESTDLEVVVQSKDGS